MWCELVNKNEKEKEEPEHKGSAMSKRVKNLEGGRVR